MSGTRHARIPRTDRDWTAEGRKRKHAVLSQRAASVAAGIADAIVTKDGPLYFLSRPDGDVPLADGHAFGLYFRDCRYLSGHELRLGGQPWRALAASAGEGFRSVLQFTNPPMAGTGTQAVAEETLSLKVVRTLDGDGQRLTETISIHNYAVDPVVLSVELTVRAGFEDIFAIRGLWPERPGQQGPPAWRDGSLRFAYDGADGVQRVLEVAFDPKPTRADGDRAQFELRLDGRDDCQMQVVFAVTEEQPTGDGYIEYRSALAEGLANQGWKDSGDAIVNADGSLARPPISMVEVQGYAYAARITIADLYERAGDGARADSLRATANRLRKRLNRDF